MAKKEKGYTERAKETRVKGDTLMTQEFFTVKEVRLGHPITYKLEYKENGKSTLIHGIFYDSELQIYRGE